MGSPEEEPGRKSDELRHEVTLTNSFYLGKFEVTVGQFRRFVQATGYLTDVEKNGGGNAHDARAVWKHTAGTSWRNPGYAGPFELTEDHPVVHVSHADARAFLAWLQESAPEPGWTYGLPTEAEWEWACRGGNADRYWWGPDPDPTGQVANVGDLSLRRVHPEWPRATMPMDDGHAFAAPVGRYRANGFGLHDMLGNVWEFCSTRYGPYPKGRLLDPGDLGTEDSFAVRGGGWSNEPADVRCATRQSDPPHFGHSNLGFRVALHREGPERLVLDALEARVRESLAAIDHPSDRAGWAEEVPRLRKKLRSSLGLDRLPKPGPQHLSVVGTLDRGTYRLEKLVYETLPGLEVPAHLYVPKSEGRHPAILFVPGHWWPDSKTKSDFQSFAISMARWGFVVLTYDPFGQGERGISLRDHRRTELLAVGVSQQAIVDFETLSALELLLSRPEVDSERIGMTGASGGGYNSWVVPALDPRVAVTVPVVGTSEFLEQIHVVRERDWYDAKEHCHFVPRLLEYANNHEFLAMIAPRPLLFISAHNDHSFRIPGNRAVAEYGSRLYRALGAPEKMSYFEDDKEGHGYQKRKREAAYGWFLRWLKGEGSGSPVAEPEVEAPPWDSPELRCFPAGENRPAGPGLVALALSLVKTPSPDPGSLPGALAGTLGIRLLPRLMATSKLEERGSGRVGWTMRDGLELCGVLLKPPGDPKGALLAAADSGRESLRTHPAVTEALASGMEVLLADPRGLGELATDKPGWTFAVSLLLGENFVGRQALDLVGGWRGLYARPELAGKPIAILGSGPFASMAALYAAVLEPRVSGLIMEGGFASYRSFIERPKTLPDSYRLLKPGQEASYRVDREIPAALIPFDVLGQFDLPDLVRSLAPRPVAVLSTIDGDFKPHPGGGMGVFFGRLPKREEPPRSLGQILSRPVDRGGLPKRVHAVEDYQTDIEKRWWMAGRIETQNVPPGSRRASRGTLANDFDDRMGDPSRIYTAVIFNPVPGPPLGKNTRLTFRYWIQGRDQLRVQIYSLSKGYHRHLLLEGLPQAAWRRATVDMTQARRPDGSGGPLEEGERIDDIQFYTDPETELLIDDIVLYDAQEGDSSGPFPGRILFTGGFDTGRQGKEWPGDFEIVTPAKPRSGRAARSVANPEGGSWIRVGLRGKRPVTGDAVRLRCWIWGPVQEIVLSTAGERGLQRPIRPPDAGGESWREVDLTFSGAPSVDEIRFLDPRGGAFLVDDILLYEPEGNP
jgi:formylglycine-generating enzyme required for sulfatase activity/dienelactone hydrolase